MAASGSLCPPFDFSGKYYDVVSGDGGSGCGRQSSFFEGKPVLNQSVGYSVILGFEPSLLSSHLSLVWLEKRYVGSKHTSEWFNTAGRNVKTGLIASVIVSQWTWAATILQSSNVAWQYGVSGPFWYASGATIQVLLFGIMAIEIKRKAPHAHTVCEIVKARWGTIAHLLPDTSRIIVHVVLVIFVYLVYTASNELGSPRVVYNHLVEVASKSRICQEPISHHGQSCGPVSGNYKGSYLTMLSSGGLVFGIINIVGNFGTVFVDNGYWVSAIAARPSSTHKGYLLGGLVWFAVPFSLATSLGGSILLLTMLFMAVTSAGSSEAYSGILIMHI
ncbi:hypothetical protein M0R45_025398 [Rubus argutus]|uniref:Uncharacterized protein n=1 Tax=Rubus argutus TaxID=59490 RepID=A0AAW1WUI0_RUBAR